MESVLEDTAVASIRFQNGGLGSEELRRDGGLLSNTALADLGFQIAHIENKSPIKLHQMDLIDQGEQEMLYYMSTVDWL